LLPSPFLFVSFFLGFFFPITFSFGCFVFLFFFFSTRVAVFLPFFIVEFLFRVCSVFFFFFFLQNPFPYSGAFYRDNSCLVFPTNFPPPPSLGVFFHRAKNFGPETFFVWQFFAPLLLGSFFGLFSFFFFLWLSQVCIWWGEFASTVFVCIDPPPPTPHPHTIFLYFPLA